MWILSVFSGIFSYLFSHLIASIIVIFERYAQRVFFSFLKRTNRFAKVNIYQQGCSLPNSFGDLKSSREVNLTIKDNRRFFWLCATRADVGFAEAFMDGILECDNFPLLFKFFHFNRNEMNGLDLSSAWFSHVMDRWAHLRRANTIEKCKKNIEDHYDLGNEMFSLFLDNSMTYSCAVFTRPDESLEDAQYNKLRMILKKADVQPSDHVLEIGSGWGSMAILAATTIGCKVTTITLSSQQKQLVENKIRSRGLEDLIDVQLIDYRNVTGQFDKIISVEMLEAVGLEYIPVYFERCFKLLKPGGRMVFQVITVPNKNYESYKRSCDFMKKYIFPGGMLASINVIVDCIEQSSPFIVEDMQNIGYHYARTLREWRQTFLKNRHAIAKLGFEESFLRKWEYYFAYCEAGFDAEYLSDYQVTLTYPRYLLEELQEESLAK
jgi:cyclopropane-fatty-acyl-phospholipid synthase